MMHFNKNHPNVIYMDKRKESHILCDGRALEINPDIVADATNIPLPSNSIFLVVIDLPHMKKLGEKSWMALKYGVLPQNWQSFIRDVFEEAYRVCKTNGTIIFKWNEDQIKIKDVIYAIGHQPIFGHPTRHSKTIWLTFMKF